MKLVEIRKALAASAVAGITAIIAAMPDGFTPEEISTIIAAFVVAGYTVFTVPNKIPEEEEK